jgi:hypothetical protein
VDVEPSDPASGDALDDGVVLSAGGQRPVSREMPVRLEALVEEPLELFPLLVGDAGARFPKVVEHAQAPQDLLEGGGVHAS